MSEPVSKFTNCRLAGRLTGHLVKLTAQIMLEQCVIKMLFKILG